MSSGSVPPESPSALWLEQSYYVATHLASVGYGIHVTLFAMTTYYSIRQRKHVKSWVKWLIFNTVLFCAGTINLACSINFNESAWITERGYPGGPLAFFKGESTRAVPILEGAASVVATLSAQGLLLYRLIVLYNYNLKIIILPILWYIVAIVLYILEMVQKAHPKVPFSGPLDLPAWTNLMAFNITLSLLTVIRLLYNRHKVIQALGPQYGKTYLNAAAFIIEGAIPFAVTSIVIAALFGHYATQSLFIPLLIQVVCIAPELIALRVMLGRITPAITQAGTLSTGDNHSQTLQFVKGGDIEVKGAPAQVSFFGHQNDNTKGTISTDTSHH